MRSSQRFFWRRLISSVLLELGKIEKEEAVSSKVDGICYPALIRCRPECSLRLSLRATMVRVPWRLHGRETNYSRREPGAVRRGRELPHEVARFVSELRPRRWLGEARGLHYLRTVELLAPEPRHAEVSRGARAALR